jgi:hypothetical protein
MIKQITQFKVIVNDLECVFLFDSSTNTAIAKEACVACLKWIGQIEDAEKAKKDAEAATETPEVKEDDQSAI